MGAKCVFIGQLDRNLTGETIVEPACNIDARQFLELCLGRFLPLAALAGKVGLFRIGL
jgi:hypothetical protein